MNESDIEAVLAANRIAWGRLVPIPPPEETVAQLEAERVELEGFARRRQLAHPSACDDYEDVLAAKEARIAALEACNAALTKALATNLRALNAALAAFTDDPPDLPEPLRRPDGTLMPQPKALTLPRETGDKRRVGS